MIKAVINVPAPRHQVYAVLTDYAKYEAWLPGCKEARVTAQNGASTDTEITIASMKTMSMALRFEADGSQGLTFRLLRSSDLKGYSGSYRLMDAADGSGTVVITEMELDAGAMVPKFMVDRMAKKSIDDTGAALREYLKKLPPAAAPAVPASSAPTAKPAAPSVKRKRARRILRVTKTGVGLEIWYMGRETVMKD